MSHSLGIRIVRRPDSLGLAGTKSTSERIGGYCCCNDRVIQAADRPVVYVASVFGDSGRRSSLGWLSHYVCRHRRGMVAMLTAFKVLPSWRSGINRFGRTDAFDCLLLK